MSASTNTEITGADNREKYYEDWDSSSGIVTDKGETPYDRAWKKNSEIATRIDEIRGLFEEVRKIYEVEIYQAATSVPELYKGFIGLEELFENNVKIVEETLLPLLLFVADSDENKEKISIFRYDLDNINRIVTNIERFLQCLDSIKLSYDRMVAPVENLTNKKYEEATIVENNLMLKKSLTELYDDNEEFINIQSFFETLCSKNNYLEPLEIYRDLKKYIEILERDFNTRNELNGTCSKKIKNINKYIEEMEEYCYSDEMQEHLNDIDILLDDFKKSSMFEQSDMFEYKELLDKRSTVFSEVNDMIDYLKDKLDFLEETISNNNVYISEDLKIIERLKKHESIDYKAMLLIENAKIQNHIFLGNDNYIYSEEAKLIAYLVRTKDCDDKRYEYYAKSQKEIIEQTLNELSGAPNTEKYRGDEAFIEHCGYDKLKRYYRIKSRWDRNLNSKDADKYIVENYMSDSPLKDEESQQTEEESIEKADSGRILENIKKIEQREKEEKEADNKLFTSCMKEFGGDPKGTINDKTFKKTLNLFRNIRKCNEIENWRNDPLNVVRQDNPVYSYEETDVDLKKEVTKMDEKSVQQISSISTRSSGFN